MRYLCARIHRRAHRVYDCSKPIGFVCEIEGFFFPFVLLPLEILRPGKMMRSLEAAKTVVIMIRAGRIV